MAFNKVLVISASKDVLAIGHTGLFGNKPEERKRLITAALKNQDRHKIPIEFLFVEEPEKSLGLAKCVHAPDLLEFYECAWQEWTKAIQAHPNEVMLQVFGESGGKTTLDDRVPAFVCKFGFASRHDGTQTPSGSILTKIAYYSTHVNTPIHESTLPTLRWDLAVTAQAVRSVLSQQTRVAYAQVIHPGHHAGASTYGGFCFLNHAAIATRLLQQKYKRVAVVDVDYHHGNGTMAIFWDDPTVFFANKLPLVKDKWGKDFTSQIIAEG